MHNLLVRSLSLLFIAAIVVSIVQNKFGAATAASIAVVDPNPLLAEWEGPYGGVPPFDKVQVALFKPALEAAMAENLSEIENIARVRSAPTFANTIVALEKAGHTMDRVTTVYGIWSSTMSNAEFQAVQREMAP